jgi:hypothetical protein
MRKYRSVGRGQLGEPVKSTLNGRSAPSGPWSALRQQPALPGACRRDQDESISARTQLFLVSHHCRKLLEC